MMGVNKLTQGGGGEGGGGGSSIVNCVFVHMLSLIHRGNSARLKSVR